MSSIKSGLKALWFVDENIRLRIALATALYRTPLIGRFLGLFVDRTMLWAYGLDVTSWSVRVRALTISHPAGVLLGGNGIVSTGRVSIMSGVKFVGRSPNDPEYQARLADRTVFRLGDNVVIGANSVVVGPVDICDNVVVAAMSLVNQSITEPGIYAGAPARRVRDTVPSDEWVAHLSAARL